MKMKSIFTILALAGTCAYANEGITDAVKAPVDNIATSTPKEQEIAEDKIYKLLASGNDPFSYGASRGGSGSSASALVPIDISNITTTIKLKGVFKLSDSDVAYALVQIGEDKNARRQLVKKDDLILINQNTKGNTQSKTSKYLQIVEIHENTVTIAPQMRPDEQIVIR